MLEEIEFMETAEDEGALDLREFYESRFVHVRRKLQDAIATYEARCASEGVPVVNPLLDDQREDRYDGATPDQVGAWKLMQADRKRRLRNAKVDEVEPETDMEAGSHEASAHESSRWEKIEEGAAIGYFGRLAFTIDTADGESQLTVHPNLQEWPIEEVMDALDDLEEHKTTRVIASFASVEAAQLAAEKLVAQGYSIPLTDKRASAAETQDTSRATVKSGWLNRLLSWLGALPLEANG